MEYEDFYEEYYDNEEEVAFINDNYKVLGRYYFNEDNHYYFLLGRNKKMGVLNFQQDDWDNFEYLLDPSFPILKYDDFEEMMSRFFNVLINQHLKTEGWNIWTSRAHELLEKTV